MLAAATPAAAQPRADGDHIDLVVMTLALPINASPEQVAQTTSQAREVMARARQCEDLKNEARKLSGATSGELRGLRVGDLRANQAMYEQIPRLPPGGVAGPFRVAEGVQVVAMCGLSMPREK
jgi:peptidyl-prolyl cis-trans isomerase SurA